MKNIKLMMASLLLVVSSVGSASGAITYFDFDPTVRVYNNGVFPLGATGSYSFDPFSDPENGTFNSFGGPTLLDVLEFGQGVFWNVDGAGGYTYAGVAGTATEFSSGATISTGATTWVDTNVDLSQSISSTTFYGIRNGSNVGWIEIRRDDTQDYTILGLAFSDSGSIEAGQTTLSGGGSAVPEPGTAAMLGIGMAMLSAARRRFQRQA